MHRAMALRICRIRRRIRLHRHRVIHRHIREQSAAHTLPHRPVQRTHRTLAAAATINRC